MKIALLSYHTCPLATEEGKITGGMNIFTYELGKALSKLGVKIDIFTRSQDPSNRTIINIDDNFRVIHLKAGAMSPLDKDEIVEHIPEFVEGFLEFHKKEEYQILDSHYFLSGVVAEQINDQLERKLPMTVMFHTLALMKNLVARGEMEKAQKYRINKEMSLSKKADKLFVPSESEKKYLSGLYSVDNKNIEVLTPATNSEVFYPIPIDFAKEKLGLDRKKKHLLFVGRLQPLKGIDAILYAMKIMSQKLDKDKFELIIVAGDVYDTLDCNDIVKNIMEIANMLGIQNSVKIVPQASQEKLACYYNAAEVVVMPSHYESFGMVALEAMTCGTPVITTNVMGISDLISEEYKSLVASVNNIFDLADKIFNLLHDEKERELISTSLYEKSKEFTWEVTARKLVASYKEILGE